MGTLDRYQKSGGFVQLLNLVETSGPAKRDKFLEMIRSEDPVWGTLIEQKMLTPQEIFSWNESVIGEIIRDLPALAMAALIHGASDEVTREKIYACMDRITKRKVKDQFESHNPTPGEISTVFIRLINEVRKLIAENRLQLDKINPLLVIETDIEEKIRNRTIFIEITKRERKHAEPKETAKTPDPQTRATDSKASAVNPAHEEALQREVEILRSQVKALQHEVAQLRSKMEQIRNLAEGKSGELKAA